MDWEYVIQQVFEKLGWGILVGVAYTLGKSYGGSPLSPSRWDYLRAFMAALFVAIIFYSPYSMEKSNPVEAVHWDTDSAGILGWRLIEKDRASYLFGTLISLAAPAVYGVWIGRKTPRKDSGPEFPTQ